MKTPLEELVEQIEKVHGLVPLEEEYVKACDGFEESLDYNSGYATLIGLDAA